MYTVNSSLENNILTVALGGHIDSTNAAAVEKEILSAVEGHGDAAWIIDADALEYISSAGLRIILRLKKMNRTLSIINVCAEVYEVFEMTGFSEMMEIKKAYRKLSVEGCEVIGQGANGKVYRLDPDTIIKVYFDPDALPDIHRERELARKAFVLGIPTAIPYDVVRVGDGYGSVFELLNAESFVKIIQKDRSRLEEVIQRYVELMKDIHATEVKPGDMPDEKQVVLGWTHFLEGRIPDEQYKKLLSMVEAIPVRTTMIHGDYHLKNVMLQNGESLLIDMDTLCTGHPIFELASAYLAYRGFSQVDHTCTEKFMGLPYELTGKIWRRTLELYFGTDDPAVLDEMEKKAMIIGNVRLLRRTIRRDPENTALIECCKQYLTDLIPTVDSLDF